ncbi:DNA-directed RNA polymerase subunit omega [Listeria sp. PSOL-1]|uniref:DNA-directed RNA polymerase subunit omega n=1 Tax=Listeria sp. PSOL-1 TaxID=1844999 RepID=UPI0013D756E0|nr:DNA-directed RNA polymerase subunit omega [Listeria sp. PSOL-1]
MLNPSIDNLLLKINSKYSLVTISAKRARELQATGKKGVLPSYESHKFVGKALEEIHAGKLVLVDQED